MDGKLSNALPNMAATDADGQLRVDGKDVAFGWNAGVLADLSKIRLGVHYRSGIKHELKGNLTISGLQGALAEGNADVRSRTRVNVPDIATLSIVVGANRPWRLLASGTWYNWSVFQDIRITIGFRAQVNGLMELSTVQETVTVSGASPLVDTREVGTKASFDLETLQNIPSARDPWVMLERTPGIFMDRANVGGNQSGQQSGYSSRGSSTGNNKWSIDGVDITDMSATGSSPIYYDFDMLEEMQVTTGGAALPFELMRDTADSKRLLAVPMGCLWPPGARIDVSVAAGAPDAFGRPLAAAVTAGFMTAPFAAEVDAGCGFDAGVTDATTSDTDTTDADPADAGTTDAP
jgi:hypothetical protein